MCIREEMVARCNTCFILAVTTGSAMYVFEIQIAKKFCYARYFHLTRMFKINFEWAIFREANRPRSRVISASFVRFIYTHTHTRYIMALNIAIDSLLWNELLSHPSCTWGTPPDSINAHLIGFVYACVAFEYNFEWDLD